MCFSTEASFITSAGIAIIGVISVKKVNKPGLLPLALIPLLFAIQQFIEGMIWLNLDHWQNENLNRILTFSYLNFVYVIWPLFSSIACYALELHRIRKGLLIITFLVGVFLAFYAHIFMLDSNSIAVIKNHSIYYQTQSPYCIICIANIYLSSTVLPYFISSYRLLNFIGILLLLSALITYLIWHITFVSVWCFFAAALSVVILSVVTKLNTQIKQNS